MSTQAFALTDNPFAMLGLSARAGRDQIEAAVARHPQRPRALANLLLDVRTRLGHELAWLQGLSGGAAEETLRLAVRGDRAEVATRLDRLRGLNKANLAAHAAERFADPAFVDAMAKAWEGVNVADAVARVNEERAVAGLPQVQEAQVKWALQGVRERHAGTAARVLTRGGSDPDALRRLIQRGGATESESGRLFIDAVAAAYGEQQSGALEQTERALLAEVDSLTRAGSLDLSRFDQLMDRERALIAPMREVALLRGREETRSLILVGDLRSIYLDPSPGAARVLPAMEIARRLQAEFPASAAIQRMVAGDLSRLASDPNAIVAPAEIDRSGSVQDRAAVRKADRERNAVPVARRGGPAHPKPNPVRVQPVRAAPSRPQPARAAVPTTATASTQAAAALDSLRRQAAAIRDTVSEELAEKPKKKGGGWPIALLIAAAFWVYNWFNDRNDDVPEPTRTVAERDLGDVQSSTGGGSPADDAREAAMVMTLLASVHRNDPPESAPIPGGGRLSLEEATYCLFQEARLASVGRLAGAAELQRLAALTRDYNSRCGRRDASASASAAWDLKTANADRLEEDGRRIVAMWRAAPAERATGS